jgi:hypothetical protein
VGKLINGLRLSMCFTFAPLYIGENCFPELRGFFLVFLNWSITYGQFFAALTARWSETLSGNAAWRVPIGMLVSSLKALSLKRNTDSAQAMAIPCAHSGHNALLSRITLLHPPRDTKTPSKHATAWKYCTESGTRISLIAASKNCRSKLRRTIK